MKYFDLYNRILKKIEDGELKSGDKLPHTLNLAKEYKVSHGTIAKALRLLGKEGYVQRVKSKGSFISTAGKKNYFEANQGKRIGWLFRGDFSILLRTPYVSESFLEASETLQKEGKQLIPIPLAKKSPEEYLDEIKSNWLAGALVNDFHLPALHAGLGKLKLPYVCTDYLDFDLPVHQVTYDHLKAGALAFRSLFARNSRNLLFIGNYHEKPRRNDTDHEYIWRSFEQSARAERLKKVKSSFIPWRDRTQVKQDIRKALLDNPHATGISCGGVTFYRAIKELFEKDPAFSDRVMDLVVFSPEKTLPPLRKRPVEVVYWSSAEIGATGAKLLASILKGNIQLPSIHYTPVELIRPV